MKVKKSKWLPPYIEEGKTTFKHLRKRSGVYIIKDGKEVLYIGHSKTQLYKTLYRHFQKWKHPFQTVFTYRYKEMSAFKVRVILTTPARAEKLEHFLIKKLKPRDNIDKYPEEQTTPAQAGIYKAMQSAKAENFDEMNPF